MIRLRSFVCRPFRAMKASFGSAPGVTHYASLRAPPLATLFRASGAR